MHRRFATMFAALGAAALISFGYVSNTDAGYKSYFGLQMSTTGRYAAGAIGLVRSGQPDNVQYIGCDLYANTSTRTVLCTARDASANYGSCSTTNANLVNVIQAMTTASYLYFTWDSTGACTYIQVENRSDHYPTVP